MTTLRAPLHPSPEISPARKLAERLNDAWDIVLGERLDEGRIRFGGLSPAVLGLTVLGIVAILALLVSLMYGNSWRHGPLVLTGTDAGRSTFVPVSLFAITLLGLSLAWILIICGAWMASRGVRLAVAAVFALVNSPNAKPVLVGESHSFAVQHGPTVNLICYLAACLGLALTAGLPRHGKGNWLRVGLLAVSLIGAVGQFATLLWLQAVDVNLGRSGDLPYLFDGAVLQLQNILLPLVFLSQLAVIKFCYGMGSVVADVGRRAANPRLLKAGLVCLILLKLWLQVGRHASSWSTYVLRRPETVVRTGIGVLVLAGAALAFRRVHDRPSEVTTERVSIGTSLALALPALVVTVVGALSYLFTNVISSDTIRRWLPRFPSSGLVHNGPVLVFAALLLFGSLRLVRSREPIQTQSAVGLIVVAGWALSCAAFAAASYEPGFRTTLADVCVTGGVAIYAAVAWKTLTAERTGQLAGLVVFAWLVGVKGNFLSLLGRAIGVQEVVIVVAGVLLSLLTESGFTGGRSPRFPRQARPLLWVGYFVLSLSLTSWSQVTHGFDVGGSAISRGLFYLGIPLAAWMAMSRRFRPATAAEEETEAPPLDLYSVG